ncbi:hypothetical protein H9Q69_004791 [Fusarium xylarioides]|uniref:Uncharacterized protein n=1 Tax=Fusarium xylarioides TaxID=221167 RepID=A0A9P7KZJ3_9HYPO|nr:hypothetical protein H9Q70_008258 [Fusarium xylarioides]KAG5758419.1 hypothetical protein H9Q72_013444 [Fusarium xylarioides]KAG5779512.1 hypothetical protein H9Q73_006812 [Fusarium xylarioides]KAG5796178.1 hypothetical protein H9Q69_004791 [Fusarium xylarioides]
MAITAGCHIATILFVVSRGGTRPDPHVKRAEAMLIDIIHAHELMTYLRTSIDLGKGIQRKGNAYNVLMIVVSRPDGQSLSRGVTAREPITAIQNRNGIPVAKRTPVLASTIYCEEAKRIVKEGTDTLFAYRDYEMGNYRRVLDSMSDHQPATAVTRQELLHSFLGNEALREEEDHKRQPEKAKNMEALGADLAKAK